MEFLFGKFSTRTLRTLKFSSNSVVFKLAIGQCRGNCLDTDNETLSPINDLHLWCKNNFSTKTKMLTYWKCIYETNWLLKKKKLAMNSSGGGDDLLHFLISLFLLHLTENSQSEYIWYSTTIDDFGIFLLFVVHSTV